MLYEQGLDIYKVYRSGNKSQINGMPKSYGMHFFSRSSQLRIAIKTCTATEIPAITELKMPWPLRALITRKTMFNTDKSPNTAIDCKIHVNIQ